MDIEKLRISKLKNYLVNVIQDLSNKNSINVNILSKDIGSYSLDKIPTDYKVERWITGLEIHKDLFSFRSRRGYSYNEIDNLKNIGFFEIFEKLIDSNNEKGILPDIDGIETIQCMNCGTMNTANTSTAEFDIQIQITYRTFNF